MRKFSGHISLSLQGCKIKFTFEMPDDATDEEIEEAAKDAAFNFLDWSYTEDNGN